MNPSAQGPGNSMSFTDLGDSASSSSTQNPDGSSDTLEVTQIVVNDETPWELTEDPEEDKRLAEDAARKDARLRSLMLRFVGTVSFICGATLAFMSGGAAPYIGLMFMTSFACIILDTPNNQSPS